MGISLGTIISWIIVGLIAGQLAGAVLNRSRRGYGLWANALLGLAGALIGGLVFSALRFDFGLGGVVVSLSDVVWAFLGALAFVAVVGIVRASNRRSAANAAPRGPGARDEPPPP